MSRRTCARTPGRDLMRVASAEPAVAVRQQPERDQPGADQTRPSAPAARQPPPPEWPPAGWRWLDPPDHADRNHHERHQRADHDGPPSPYAAFRHLETLGPHRLDPPGRPLVLLRQHHQSCRQQEQPRPAQDEGGDAENHQRPAQHLAAHVAGHLAHLALRAGDAAGSTIPCPTDSYEAGGPAPASVEVPRPAASSSPSSDSSSGFGSSALPLFLPVTFPSPPLTPPPTFLVVSLTFPSAPLTPPPVFLVVSLTVSAVPLTPPPVFLVVSLKVSAVPLTVVPPTSPSACIISGDCADGATWLRPVHAMLIACGPA